MGHRYVELRSVETRRLAFQEVISRIRQREPVGGLTDSSRSVLGDQRIDAMAEQLLRGRAIRILFDLDAFNFASEGIELKWWEEVMLQYFVQNQASISMIRAMFPGVSRSEIERMRLRLLAAPPGKATLPAESELARIREAWRRICGDVRDIRECYYSLHQSFPHLTLTTLFALLNVRRD